MSGKSRFILGGGAALAILLAALQATGTVPLNARTARDVVLYDAEDRIVVRMREPGEYTIAFPCEHAEGKQETLTMELGTAPVRQTELDAAPPDWYMTVQRGDEVLARLDLPADEEDEELDEDFEFPCSHVDGREHDMRVLIRAFPETDLLLGERRVAAEVMNTHAKRSWGLQGRAELPDDYGMWFIYDEPVNAVFVMKTVSFPISIAFVRSDGIITNIERLNPGDLRRAYSTEPVKYVLEMEQGWFEQHEIGPGAVVKWPGATTDTGSADEE